MFVIQWKTFLISNNVVNSGKKKEKEGDKKANKLNGEMCVLVCIVSVSMCMNSVVQNGEIHSIVESLVIFYCSTVPFLSLWNLADLFPLYTTMTRKRTGCTVLKPKYYLHRVNCTNLKCIAQSLIFYGYVYLGNQLPDRHK